jgi:hypothetical protein
MKRASSDGLRTLDVQVWSAEEKNLKIIEKPSGKTVIVQRFYVNDEAMHMSPVNSRIVGIVSSDEHGSQIHVLWVKAGTRSRL